MFRKSFSYLAITVAVVLAAQTVAYSQFAPVNGTVVVKKDGKNVPVADAVIQVFRTDIKGTFPEAKTNKRGEFNFVGMPYGATYVFSISAPNVAPMVYPDIKAGMEKLVIAVEPGDGRKFTEAEVRQAAANAPKPGGSESGGMTEDQKKQQADFEKKNAEITAKNERIKSGDAIVQKANAEGEAAFKAGNLNLAITKFSEGIAAVPDFIGSTPILINKKMSALQDKGSKFYREGTAAAGDAELKKAKFQEANKFYDEGLVGFQDALGVMSRAETTVDPAELKKRDVMKRDLYSVAADIHRIKVATGIDRTKMDEAKTVIAEYLTLETRPDIKLAFQIKYGDMLQTVGDLEKAIEIYRQVLELKPDNADVMGKLGLTLFGLGAASENKQLEQAGLNYMQKYLDMAPISDTDTQAVKDFKKDIKDSIEYLTKTQKLTPQKPASGATKKKK